MSRSLFVAFGVLASGAAFSQSFTVATFADPATSSATPLFFFDTTNNVLSGSWTGSGLTLQTPGFTGAGSDNDVKFEMDDVILTTIVPNSVYSMGAGVINFWTTDQSNPIFTITFGGGTFVNPFSLGSSDLIGNNVTFSGPEVPSGLSNEAYSFGLTNAAAVSGGFNYTASFTSSAVPEPASLIALGLGIASLAARRKGKR